MGYSFSFVFVFARMNAESVLGDWESFLSRIFSALSSLPLPVAHYELDHVCYRVADNDLYEQKKKELGALGILLHETLIGGRMIATYQLHQPLQYGVRLRLVTPVIFLTAIPPHRTAKFIWLSCHL